MSDFTEEASAAPEENGNPNEGNGAPTGPLAAAPAAPAEAQELPPNQQDVEEAADSAPEQAVASDPDPLADDEVVNAPSPRGRRSRNEPPPAPPAPPTPGPDLVDEAVKYAEAQRTLGNIPVVWSGLASTFASEYEGKMYVMPKGVPTFIPPALYEYLSKPQLAWGPYLTVQE